MTRWSDEQRRLLAAMGYTLYARAGAVPPAMPAAIVAEPPVAAGVIAVPDALRGALQRAAADRRYEHLIDDFEALRRDPARKRALWPKLRALRKGL